MTKATFARASTSPVEHVSSNLNGDLLLGPLKKSPKYSSISSNRRLSPLKSLLISFHMLPRDANFIGQLDSAFDRANIGFVVATPWFLMGEESQSLPDHCGSC